MGAFGEKLRQQREQRGIELDAISNTTKISTRMLRALEEEHFDQLPGGVFNKGFVRAYARYVGLDEEEAITDYLAALRESQVQAQQILPNFRATTPKSDEFAAAQLPSARPASKIALEKIALEKNTAEKTGPSKARVLEEYPRNQFPGASKGPTLHAPAANSSAERFPRKYPAGILAEPAGEPSTSIPWEKVAAALLLVALALAFLSYRRNHRNAPSPTASAASQPPVPFSASASSASPDHTTPAPEPEAPKTEAPRTGASTATPPEPAPASVPQSAARTSVAAAPPTTSITAIPSKPSSANPVPASSSAAPSQETGASRKADDEDANPPVAAAKTTPRSSVKAPAPFTLLIRATETSWVSITADGNPVAAETLIAPAGTSVRAAHEIVVRAGNAAGVSFRMNGRDIPAQGNEGEVKIFIFDSNGLLEAQSAQPTATH